MVSPTQLCWRYHSLQLSQQHDILSPFYVSFIWHISDYMNEVLSDDEQHNICSVYSHWPKLCQEMTEKSSQSFIYPAPHWECTLPWAVLSILSTWRGLYKAYSKQPGCPWRWALHYRHLPAPYSTTTPTTLWPTQNPQVFMPMDCCCRQNCAQDPGAIISTGPWTILWPCVDKS